MKVFLDANVLVSVLNKEYPVFQYSSRILSLIDTKNVKLFTSPICIAIAYYFAEKKSGSELARVKIEYLIHKLNITTVNQTTAEIAIKNKKNLDIEDGLQYYSAIESGCKHIVTEDKNDFYFSEIEVLNSKTFLENYFFLEIVKLGN